MRVTMALEDAFDPFAALGLERDAGIKAIRSRYYELARRYHPNRNQGSDESKSVLAEHFHNVHQAWQLLSETGQRRRCIELLELCELQEVVLTSVADLLYEDEYPEPQQREQHVEHSTTAPDGHVSSDADDDDLPRIAGIKRRATFEKQKPAKRSKAGLDDIEEGSESSGQEASTSKRKAKLAKLRTSHASGRNDEDSSDNANTAAERRKRFDRLRRKEYEAFNRYRDAMVEKFEAEAAAQRHKEEFERARWRREYYQRAPKDSSQRVRLLKLFNAAAKALTPQQPLRRRNTSNISFGAPPTPVAGEPVGHLSLPSRMKSVHRRVLSSDVTGDQTDSDSSDNETSPHRPSRHHSPRPGRPKHRRWDSLPNVATHALPPALPNGKHDPISPITGPGPKVFVRTPTNLAEMSAFNIEGSDVDSASVSSRSNSPGPAQLKKNDSARFVLVPHSGAADMFGGRDDRRSRSPNGERRSPSADRRSVSATRNGAHSPAQEACQFLIKTVGKLHHHHIPFEHVHLLTYDERQWMLGTEPDADMPPDVLLQRLSRLDPVVASGFMVKADIKAKFNFRLVYSHREVVKQQHQTFIALSYRRKIHVEKRHGHFTLPLEPEMFQAVWDERLSDTEGVWIDQVCIDGESEDEKLTSMSAMDMVYRSARLVVVALDDIELEAHEASILENHMAEYDRQVHIPASKRFRKRQTPYLEAHDDLYGVIRKLMKSSWFQRAWCRHEMRLAREHIFLVPCRIPGSWSGKSVLRFTGKCLTHFIGLATEVPFEQSIESVKAALYAFFRDRSKLASHEHHMRAHHGNFTTVVAEVFAMQAGGDPKIPEEQREADARKDKIAIILNTMECGLALSPKMRDTRIGLPTHECHYMLLLLALAARDPGALGSVGRPLRRLPYGLTSSWLSEPTNVDSGLNNYRTLNRLPETCRISSGKRNGEHFVTLALKFINQDNAVSPEQSTDSLGLATHFMEVCETAKYGRNRKRYLINDTALNRIFGSMRDIYIETLACVFECGPLWMGEVCERYGVSRWKHDLQCAYELLIALKNTMGKWPETAWGSQAPGFIMDFVNFLIVRGLPHRQITEPEPWRPVWVPTLHGGRVLTFAPKSKGIRVAVPVALFDSDYIKLARLWVLRPRGGAISEGGQHQEWSLLGKSVLFSDDLSMGVLERDHGTIRRGQKVFGRVWLSNIASSAMSLQPGPSTLG